MTESSYRSLYIALPGCKVILQFGPGERVRAACGVRRKMQLRLDVQLLSHVQSTRQPVK